MSDSTAEPPLAPFKDEVLGALISGVATLVTARAALEGHTELGFVVLKVNNVLGTTTIRRSMPTTVTRSSSS
jgi:hypothetical protein